jgi:hypothetical protein
MTMTIDWDFTAQSFLDQLPEQDQKRVLHAVERLGSASGRLDTSRLENLPSLPAQAGTDNHLLRVGNDLRVVLQRHDNAIRIIDVFRQSQIEGLRQLQRHD